MVGSDDVLYLKVAQHLHGRITVPPDTAFMLQGRALAPTRHCLQVDLVTDGENNIIFLLHVGDALSKRIDCTFIMERHLQVAYDPYSLHNFSSNVVFHLDNWMSRNVR